GGIRGLPVVQARGGVRRQFVVEHGAVGAHRGLHHLHGKLRRVHLLRRHLEHHRLGIGEGVVDVARQRIVVGLEQVEGAEQVDRVVRVRRLPQQGQRRVARRDEHHGLFCSRSPRRKHLRQRWLHHGGEGKYGGEQRWSEQGWKTAHVVLVWMEAGSWTDWWL